MPFSFFFRNQVTAYVILFIERDGSTYLSSILMSHPEILANYERFAELKQQNVTGAEQLAWANEFFTPPLLGRKAAYGFKTKLVDVLDMPGFEALLKSKNCKIIHMRRNNTIKAVVSRINAKRLHDATGKWNLYKEEDRMPPMNIDPAQFAQFLQEREDAEDALSGFVKRLGLPTLLVTYENLLMEKESTIANVLSFLNVRQLPVQGKTMKHTRDNLREVVENFDALQAAYRGTKYEPMFTEVLEQPIG